MSVRGRQALGRVSVGLSDVITQRDARSGFRRVKLGLLEASEKQVTDALALAWDMEHSNGRQFRAETSLKQHYENRGLRA